MKKLRLSATQVAAFVARTGGGLLRSRLLQVWIGLCLVGLWVGTQARPEATRLAIEWFDLYLKK